MRCVREEFLTAGGFPNTKLYKKNYKCKPYVFISRSPVAYETEYCILGVMFHIVYGALLIARLMCSVLYTLLCYYCIL